MFTGHCVHFIVVSEQLSPTNVMCHMSNGHRRNKRYVCDTTFNVFLFSAVKDMDRIFFYT